MAKNRIQIFFKQDDSQCQSSFFSLQMQRRLFPRLPPIICIRQTCLRVHSHANSSVLELHTNIGHYQMPKSATQCVAYGIVGSISLFRLCYCQNSRLHVVITVDILSEDFFLASKLGLKVVMLCGASSFWSSQCISLMNMTRCSLTRSMVSCQPQIEYVKLMWMSADVLHQQIFLPSVRRSCNLSGGPSVQLRVPSIHHFLSLFSFHFYKTAPPLCLLH